MNMRTKFEVRSFARSWDNSGHPKNLGSPWIRRRSFLRNFKWAFVWMDIVNVPTKFEVRGLTRSWDNGDWSFGWCCKPPSLGKGMVSFERALASSYMPSIATFPLALRTSEILLLLCSCTPLFCTPPLVSPNFPMHVPLGVGGCDYSYLVEISTRKEWMIVFFISLRSSVCQRNLLFKSWKNQTG